MSETIGTPAPESSNPSNDAWNAFVKPFADAVDKTSDEVTAALRSLIGEPGQQAIDVLSSEEYSSFEDISEAVTNLGIAKGVLKKAIKEHLRSSKKAEIQPVIATSGSSFEILPSVPDDKAWLAALRVDGDLKPETNTVIAGMKSALASRSGMNDIPSLLIERMEAHANSLDEPVGADFFRLSKLLTQRNYSEVFAALEIDGRKYATQGRKNEFVERLDSTLWPALIGFQNQLKNWSDSWSTAFANPGAAMGMMAAALGGRSGVLPPTITEPPAVDGLIDAATSVINQINRVFSGTGVVVARAMAYDAQCIKEVLENPSLPSQIGAANKVQMLKQLDVAIAPDYVRLEQNICRYTLAVMELPNKTADAVIPYITSLLMLGSQIPWDKLSVPAKRGSKVQPRESERHLDDDDESYPRRNRR